MLKEFEKLTYLLFVFVICCCLLLSPALAAEQPPAVSAENDPADCCDQERDKHHEKMNGIAGVVAAHQSVCEGAVLADC